jgi:hypothetical protein
MAAKINQVVPCCAVTFIEVHINEDESVLEKVIRDAHASLWAEHSAPARHPCGILAEFRFGRVIVWQGRMFQQLEFSHRGNTLTVENPIPDEEKVFGLWKLPRARIQVGSMQSEVFTTPPEAEGEPAARIKEGGECEPEYLVRPFYYSDYRDDDLGTSMKRD